MEIIIQPTKEAATTIAADLVARLIRNKPDTVLGLATGSTPELLYRKLVELNLDWSRVRTFNLDEYIGLPEDHSQSYVTFTRLSITASVAWPGWTRMMILRRRWIEATKSSRVRAAWSPPGGPGVWSALVV